MKITQATKLVVMLLLTLALSGCSCILAVDDDGVHRENLEDSSRLDRGGVESW